MAKTLFLGLLLTLMSVSCADDKGRLLGDVCVTDKECASSRCDELVCKAKNPSERGASCVHPLDCVSEVCTLKTCAAGTRQEGQSCTHDLQCASAACIGGYCTVSVADGGTSTDVRVVDATMETPHRL